MVELENTFLEKVIREAAEAVTKPADANMIFEMAAAAN